MSPMAFFKGHHHFRSKIPAGASSAFTVYVDNLPNGVGLPWFHKFFSNFGSINDVYLPIRRSKRTGNRFGFVRYKSTEEAHQAMDKANGIWIGKRSLSVERALYDKGSSNSGIPVVRGNIKPSSFYENHYQKKDIEKRFTLNVQPIASEWLMRSAVAKLKDLSTPELVQKAFFDLKFTDVSVKSMGGLILIITFRSKEERLSALHNPLVTNCFSSIKPWNGEAAGVSRLIWLKCRGMPLSAWNVLTFKRIGAMWGDFITLDEETLKEEAYDVGRLLIATEYEHKIDEWINIIVRGRNHKVRIWEEDCNDIFSEKPLNDWVQKQQSLSSSPQSTPFKQAKEDELSKNGAPIREIETNDRVVSPRVIRKIVDPNEHVLTNEMENSQLQADVAMVVSNSLHLPKLTNQLANTRDDSEESKVDETPVLGNQQQDFSGTNVVLGEVGTENNERINEDGFSDILTAKERRFRRRREVRELLDSVDHLPCGEGNGNIQEFEESYNSESINSEDIERRNVCIRNAYEKALNDSKRLGVIHLESDEMVIQRMMQFHKENTNNNNLIEA